MGWLIKVDMEGWQFGPNLKYGLKNTWEAANPESGRTEPVDELQAILPKDLPFWGVLGNRVVLHMDVE